MKSLINFSLMLFLGMSLSAQDFNKQKMDSLFSAIDENNKGMGSLSIYKNGNEVYTSSTGFANVEAKKAADAQTRYRVGSITKTFTAAIIMQLIEEGKLQLETKLSAFYPQIPNAGKISIEDLLRHQSGLFNYSKGEDFENWKNKEQSRQDHLDRFVKNGIEFQPGEKSDYSNTNYILLSFIIEDLEKEDLSEVLYRRIVKPLQLKNTYYGSKLDPSKGEALAYQKTGEWTLIDETHMSVVKGAGALMSTPSDLNKFVTVLFAGKIVKPATLEKMKEIKGEFGLGLMEMDLVGRNFYGHTGGIDGFNSVVVYNPTEKVSFAYSSNGRDLLPHKILDAAAHIYFGEAYEIPSFKTLELTAGQLKQYEGIYSGEGFPLILKIYEENGKLMGQVEGQPSFPLEAFEPHKFKFDRFGLKLEFDPEAGKMLFKQGPNSHELKRA